MITLITNRSIIKFNLKTGFNREIDLCRTLASLKLKNSNAKITISTSSGEVSVSAQDIVDFKFVESEYEPEIPKEETYEHKIQD